MSKFGTLVLVKHRSPLIPNYNKAVQIGRTVINFSLKQSSNKVQSNFGPRPVEGLIKNKIEELKITHLDQDCKLSPLNGHRSVEDEMVKNDQDMQDLTLKKDEEAFEMADQDDRTGKNCMNRMNSNDDMIPYELPGESEKQSL